MIVYDPRDNTYKESDNPALILNEIIEQDIRNSEYINLDSDYYRFVIGTANYCDEEVNEPKTD